MTVIQMSDTTPTLAPAVNASTSLPIDYDKRLMLFSGRANPPLAAKIADIIDAANTYALFVWGPERIKLEYVEHKASFSLV